jgi:flagellum-specific peptidoglycan hydrolase FlgJ
MKQPFAVYNNLPEYIKAKLAVVSKWDVLNHDPKEYFTRIVSGKMKYATDPNYASKLTNFHKQVWHE